MRTLIIGGPKTGKTTLAAAMGGGRSTDEVMGLGWSEASEEVSKWFDSPGPWIIEGVAIPRALRKWAARNPGQPPPVDKVILLRTPHERRTPHQIIMAAGIDTVLSEISPWLSQVPIETPIKDFDGFWKI